MAETGINQYFKKLAEDAYNDLEKGSIKNAKQRVILIKAKSKKLKKQEKYKEIFELAKQILKLFKEAQYRKAEELLLKISEIVLINQIVKEESIEIAGYKIKTKDPRLIKELLDIKNKTYLDFIMKSEQEFFLILALFSIDAIINRKINAIVTIDKSGRILGFFLYKFLRQLGIKDIPVQFMYCGRRDKVYFYKKKTIDILRNKRILLIDEYSESGGTLETASDYISKKCEASVYPFALVGKDQTAIIKGEPSWHHDENVSGLEKVDDKILAIKDKTIIVTVRKQLSQFAKKIAEIIKKYKNLQTIPIPLTA